MSKRLGVPVQVINKPGGGGVVGFAEMTRAKPDGYTIGTWTPGPGISQIVAGNTPYKMSDYQSVGGMLINDFVLAARGDIPANNLKDFAAWAKKNGVTPPSYAILEEPTKVSRQSDADLRKKISSSIKGDSCCGASNKKDNGASLLASCTSQWKVPIVHCKTKKTLVLTMLALKCQGKDSVFTHLPWMALPMARPTVALEVAPVIFDCLPMRVLISVSLDLDTPPPKPTFA
jgi:hypothetical protein